MICRWPLFMALLVYVTLDLSLPAMPGAFVFDPANSVESAQRSRPGVANDIIFSLAPVRDGEAVVEREVDVPRPVFPSREIERAPLRQPGNPMRAATLPLPSDDPH